MVWHSLTPSNIPNPVIGPTQYLPICSMLLCLLCQLNRPAAEVVGSTEAFDCGDALPGIHVPKDGESNIKLGNVGHIRSWNILEYLELPFSQSNYHGFRCKINEVGGFFGFCILRNHHRKPSDRMTSDMATLSLDNWDPTLGPGRIIWQTLRW